MNGSLIKATRVFTLSGHPGPNKGLVGCYRGYPLCQRSCLVGMCLTRAVCSGSIVVTAYDFEFGRPGSSPEWGSIYYEASITAQGSSEHSSLRGSALGTRATEHKGCYWGMQVD